MTTTTERGSKFRNRGEHYVRQIPVGSIRPDPEQPRKVFDEEALRELAASIKENGLLQPIAVRPDPENEDGYLIIAGERRFRAHLLNGAAKVKAMILDADEGRATKLQLIENLNRVDLNPVERATAYRKMLDDGYEVEDVAKAVGTTNGNIEWWLKLLDAHEEVLQQVVAGTVNTVSAISIGKLSGDGQRQVLATLSRNKLTTREIELLCKRIERAEVEGETVLFAEGQLTEPQRAAVKDFETAFKSICSTLGKMQEMEKEAPGTLAHGLANPAAVEAQVDEVIKGLYQVRNSLRVHRVGSIDPNAS